MHFLSHICLGCSLSSYFYVTCVCSIYQLIQRSFCNVGCLVPGQDDTPPAGCIWEATVIGFEIPGENLDVQYDINITTCRALCVANTACHSVDFKFTGRLAPRCNLNAYTTAAAAPVANDKYELHQINCNQGIIFLGL